MRVASHTVSAYRETLNRIHRMRDHGWAEDTDLLPDENEAIALIADRFADIPVANDRCH